MVKKLLFIVSALCMCAFCNATVEKAVTTTSINTLKSQLPNAEWGTVNKLVITGPMGDADIDFLSNVAKATNQLTELDMSGVTDLAQLKKSAFSGLKSLGIVSLPASLNTIDEKAFMDCPNLAVINMPAAGLTTIADRAFCNCTSLSTITLPSTLGSIASSAFNGDTSLQEIKVAPGSEYLSSIYGVLYTMEDQTLLFYPMARGDEEFVIPDGTTKIGENAFTDVKTLKSIEFPESVKEIGKNAFNGCSNLNILIIGDGVTKIDDYAFLNCSGLTAISLPKSLKTLGDGVFVKCCNITSVRCENPVPPTTRPTAAPFFSQDESICHINAEVCEFSIPKGSAAKYAESEIWKVFTNIDEFQVGKETPAAKPAAQKTTPKTNKNKKAKK